MKTTKTILKPERSSFSVAPARKRFSLTPTMKSLTSKDVGITMTDIVVNVGALEESQFKGEVEKDGALMCKQVIGARSRFGARFNTTEMLDRISPPFSISTKSTEGKILDQAKVELRWKCMTQNGACLELSIFKSKTKTGDVRSTKKGLTDFISDQHELILNSTLENKTDLTRNGDHFTTTRHHDDISDIPEKISNNTNRNSNHLVSDVMSLENVQRSHQANAKSNECNDIREIPISPLPISQSEKKVISQDLEETTGNSRNDASNTSLVSHGLNPSVNKISPKKNQNVRFSKSPKTPLTRQETTEMLYSRKKDKLPNSQTGINCSMGRTIHITKENTGLQEMIVPSTSTPLQKPNRVLKTMAPFPTALSHYGKNGIWW